MSLGDRAEIAALRGAENIDRRLHVVVRDDAFALTAADVGQAAEQLRAAPCAAGDRNIFQVAERIQSYCGVCTTIG